MRISAKGRYAIASLILMAQGQEKQLNVSQIAQELGISKIYLEQVFSQLKKEDIVVSTKGSRGGYSLAENPKDITAFNILIATEASLFEKTEKSVSEDVEEINDAMDLVLWDKLDASVANLLKSISLEQLAEKAKDLKNGPLMYYI